MKKYANPANFLEKVLYDFYRDPLRFEKLNFKQNNNIYKTICESHLHNYYFQQIIPLFKILNQNVIQNHNQYKKDICYIITTLCKFNICNSTIFKIFEDVYFKEKYSHFSAKDLMSTYWAYFKLRLQNVKAMQCLSAQIFEKIKNIDNNQIIIQALYIFLCKPPPNLKLIKDLYLKLLKNFNNQFIYNRKTTTQILKIKYLEDRANLKFQQQLFLNIYNTSKYICQLNHKLNGVKQFTYKNNDDQSSLIQLIEKKGKHSSITQIIVSQSLNRNYYQFQRNVLIGGFQYDFLINKKRQKQTPLKNKKKQNQNEVFEKTVLQINGPIHYITSDIKQNNDLIIATSQLKSQFLKKFNIHKFKQLNVKQWQKFNLLPNKQDEFLRNIIQNKLK